MSCLLLISLSLSVYASHTRVEFTLEKMTTESEEYRVLRVTQLDTHELDVELLNQYKLVTEECFKYIRSKFISKYHGEINTAIKFVIWYFTYYKNSQTIGQSILDWSYKAADGKLEAVKKLIHLVFFCFDDILESKIQNQGLLGVVRVFKFLNFLKFLYSGDHFHLWERLFRFKPIYKEQQDMRQINTDFTERELIWQSYFLLIKLLNSVFNFKTMTISRLILQDKKENDENAVDIDEDVDALKCRACHDTSLTNAFRYKSCRFNHFYCYYCIKSTFSKRNSCKLCSNDIVEASIE